MEDSLRESLAGRKGLVMDDWISIAGSTPYLPKQLHNIFMASGVVGLHDSIPKVRNGVDFKLNYYIHSPVASLTYRTVRTLMPLPDAPIITRPLPSSVLCLTIFFRLRVENQPFLSHRNSTSQLDFNEVSFIQIRPRLLAPKFIPPSRHPTIKFQDSGPNQKG